MKEREFEFTQEIDVVLFLPNLAFFPVIIEILAILIKNYKDFWSFYQSFSPSFSPIFIEHFDSSGFRLLKDTEKWYIMHRRQYEKAEETDND